jgi:hypothetical protein
MQPGATVEVDSVPGEDGAEPEVKITITQPKRKREAVGVGAKGEAAEGGGELPSGDASSDDLPDEPEVLPDVPDAPPAAEASEDKPE